MKPTVPLPKCYTASLPKQLRVSFTENHMQLLLCSVWLKGRGSEHLLSPATQNATLPPVTSVYAAPAAGHHTPQ